MSGLKPVMSALLPERWQRMVHGTSLAERGALKLSTAFIRSLRSKIGYHANLLHG